MKTTIFTLFLLLLGISLHAQVDASQYSQLKGSWEGDLEIPGTSTSLRIVINVKANSNGKLDATMDSPDQGAYDIKTNGVEKAEDQFFIEVPNIGGKLEFSYIDSNNTWDGTWSQMGSQMNITLAKMSQEDEEKTAKAKARPQEPQPPYPYLVEEVKFFNQKDSIHLAGTLTLPDSTQSHPAVVLITGSGAQDRDETLMGHKPFKVIADYLTRQGIAVLRFDDRGFGESEGNFQMATTRDFATDAIAAIQYLQQHRNIDTNALGLIGHSEGGLVAPIASNRDGSIDYIILIAGPAVSGDTIMIAQSRLIMEKSGDSDAEMLDRQEALQRAIFGFIRKGEENGWSVTQIRDSVDSVCSNLSAEAKEELKFTDAMVNQSISQLVSPWMRKFITYDPKQDLRKLNIPVLAIFGENDLQVPPETTKAPMERALQQAPTDDYEVIIFEGLNHLMQTSETGLPSNYSSINETFSPKVLEKMSTWIIYRTK